MKAFATSKAWDFRFELHRVSLLEMAELLDTETVLGKSAVFGVPVYFDSSKRVWPRAAEGIAVVFEEG